MEVVRSIPILLDDDGDLRATVKAFGHVRRDLSAVAFNGGKPLGAVPLHRSAYASVKGRLSAQMTCSAIRSVASAYAAAKSNKRPAKAPFDFTRDVAVFLVGRKGRDVSFRKDGMLSVWTVAGRKRMAYQIPERLRPLFGRATVVNSMTVREGRDGRLSATLSITIEVPDPAYGRPVGVDLNATNAVVAVNLQGDVFFETGLATRVRNKRTRKTVRRLQVKKAASKAVGRSTRSVRRALKRLGRKRSNRTRDFVRCVAKRLVEWAGPATLVFELLKFDRRRKDHRLKAGTRRKLAEWPRGMVLQAVRNRAELVGVPVVLVDPAYTSQNCSVCGNLGERNRHEFSCPTCGCRLHADVNAAINIRRKFAASAPPTGGPPSVGPEARGSSRASPRL
jgi:IS605 OrfB family transposase